MAGPSACTGKLHGQVLHLGRLDYINSTHTSRMPHCMGKTWSLHLINALLTLHLPIDMLTCIIVGLAIVYNV
jgi:hypothetical protein